MFFESEVALLSIGFPEAIFADVDFNHSGKEVLSPSELVLAPAQNWYTGSENICRSGMGLSDTRKFCV